LTGYVLVERYESSSDADGKKISPSMRLLGNAKWGSEDIGLLVRKAAEELLCILFHCGIRLKRLSTGIDLGGREGHRQYEGQQREHKRGSLQGTCPVRDRRRVVVLHGTFDAISTRMAVTNLRVFRCFPQHPDANCRVEVGYSGSDLCSRTPEPQMMTASRPGVGQNSNDRCNIRNYPLCLTCEN
jgi:hypothetical protein